MFGTSNPLPNLAPWWNVAPTDNAPVVENSARHLDLLKTLPTLISVCELPLD
jgi:hypothetical protein